MKQFNNLLFTVDYLRLNLSTGYRSITSRINHIPHSIIIPVLLVGTLFSCGLEKEIDYDVYYSGDRFVVQGFMGKSEGVQVMVTKSTSPINRGDSTYVSGAEVWIDADGKPYTQLIETDSSYFTLKAPVDFYENVDYTIRVSAPGLSSVVSTPQRLVAPMYVDTVFVSRKSSDSGKWFIGFGIQNDLTLNDYFTSEVHTFQNGTDRNYSEYNQDIRYIKTDKDYNQNIISFEQEMNTRLPMERDSNEEYDYYSYPIDSVQVKAITVSKEYYDFWNSYNDYEGGYGDEFQEKIFPVKSNIINGYGFFATCEKTTYTLIGPITRK